MTRIEGGVTNVPRHLPNKLEYKFLCCISVHYQSRMTSNRIANTPSRFHSAGRAIWIALTVQAGLGWGGWLRTNVYAACSGGVVGLSWGDVDSCGDVPQYKVMKYLVFGIISTSLLRRICTRSTVFYKCFLRTSTRTHMSAHAHAR